MTIEQHEAVVGYLVTLPNGYACRLGPDLGRAQHYAAEQRAVSIEVMYVRRDGPQPRQNPPDAPISAWALSG